MKKETRIPISNRSDLTTPRQQWRCPMKTQILFLMALLCAVVASVHSTQAATIAVTNTNDSGPGSLRGALAVAHDGDTIDATDVVGRIVLTSGALQITHSVSITGPGAGNLAIATGSTACDCIASSSVFENFASNATISGFTITQSKGGAVINQGGLKLSNSSVVRNDGVGISNSATLTITNCTVSGNDGGGISNSATLTITNCTIRGNSGGGISNSATLTITNCTISGNSASNGGGISNSAALTVSNCTVSGNSASNGGGIFNVAGFRTGVTINNSTLSGNSATGNGGGIFNDAGAIITGGTTISNSTLSGNSATGSGGAIYNAPGGVHFSVSRVSVKNSTISGNSAPNGGGIYNNGASGGAEVELGSTILNAGSSGQNIANFGAVHSFGYNLASDNGGGVLRGPGDRINTNPMLGLLTHNGGPTLTHALLAGSPAIDAGDPNFTPPPSFDQRGPGHPRVVNGRIDIGSFEVQ